MSAKVEMYSRGFSSSRRTRQVILILLVAWMLRLAMLYVFADIPIDFDQSAYIGQAATLVREGFARWNYDGRAPLYTIFVAANLVVSGGISVPFVRITQSLLETTTVALVYASSQLIFVRLAPDYRHRVGLLAAGWMALYPDYVFFSQTLWSETFFVFVAALAFYVLLRAFRASARVWAFGAAGILWGLAALTREMVLIFVLALVPLWLWLGAHPRTRVGIQRGAIFVAGALLAILPWTYRNYVQGQGFELISWQGGYDFWRYNARFLDVPMNVEEFDRATAGGERNAIGYREGFKVIAAQPVRWILRKSVEAAGFWSRLESNFVRTSTRLEMISEDEWAGLQYGMMLLWIGVVAFTAIGLIQDREPVVKLLFLFYLLASLLVFFAVHYIPRYRLAVLAYFLPYTAYGLLEVVSAVREFTRTRRVTNWPRLALIALILILVGSSYPNAFLAAR